MCDYSLRHIASRPAQSGDRLVLTRFPDTISRGFTAVGQPHQAVCLLPGTQLAFDGAVLHERWLPILGIARRPTRVASFIKTTLHLDAAHHDALEFADGKIVLLTKLCEGQVATVLQPPAMGAKGPTLAPRETTI